MPGPGNAGKRWRYSFPKKAKSDHFCVCWVIKQAVAPATIYTFQYGFLYGRWILCK